MTGADRLIRPDPIAVESIWHAMAEMHQRYWTRLDIFRIEHRKIAAVFARAPDRRQQVLAEPFAAAVDMHDAGQRAERRQIGVGAGVPAVAAWQTGAAIVDAR